MLNHVEQKVVIAKFLNKKYNLVIILGYIHLKIKQAALLL